MGFFSKKSKDPNPVNDAVKKSIQEAEIKQAILLANKAWNLVKETL